MKILKFEELPIWRLSLKITKEIYDLGAKKELSRDFGLRDQLRRSIVSVSSNIVEGFEKNNNNELIRFLKIAKGSVGETRNQIFICLTVKYINQSEFNNVNNELIELSNQIGGFINYLSIKRINKEFLNK